MYFHEFIERVQRAGLKYLAETDFRTMLTESFDTETAALLQNVPLLQQEQYMDFLRNRTFRSSVLCHADQSPDLNVSAQRLVGCCLMLEQRLNLDQAIHPTTEPLNLMLGQSEITVSHPVTKLALVELSRTWPAWVHFDELLRQAVRQTSATSLDSDAGLLPTAEQRDMLARDLMTLYLQGLLRIRLEPPSIAYQPGQLPAVTPLVRTQARLGNVVVNRHHESLRVDDLTRALLCQLDGKHPRDFLRKWLAEAFARGEFQVHRGQTQVTELDDETLTTILDGALQATVDHALLVG